MRRWNPDVIEALVLDELNELAHWAMTDEERAGSPFLDRRSVEGGVPDGRRLTPPLLDVIDWVGGIPGRARSRPLPPASAPGRRGRGPG
ncbi:MAG: hypothetical protein ABEH66_06710 [Halobacteriales archaeon]